MSNSRSNPLARRNCHLVRNSQALHRAIQSLERESFVTVDTEFIREKTYWPILCLVQVGGSKETFLIDMLSPDLDTRSLGELMQNKKIVKVFHAARQDIEIFLHHFGDIPAPIFDTQIAAMVAGFGDQVGYANLIQALCDHHINKDQRYTDWSKRPLSTAQCIYAAEDVTWLRQAYNVLKEKLHSCGREHWVQEEMANLLDPQSYLPPLERMYNKTVQRLKTEDRYRLGLIKALIQFRETQAQRRNIPRHYALRDEQIASIVKSMPKSSKELGGVRGLPPRFSQSSMGRTVLEIIRDTLSKPLNALPQAQALRNNAKIQEAPKELIALLRSLLSVCCRSYKVAPRLIASSSLLEEIALEPKKIPQLIKGWRWQVFGQFAQDLCASRIALGIREGRVELISIEEGRTS